MTFLLILSLIFPDFDDNGVVDFADFLLFVSHFGTDTEAYDLDSNGVVSFSDFLLFVEQFGKKHPSKTFNLELVIVEKNYRFTDDEKALIRQAVRRWEQVIVGDINGSAEDGIDDIRLHVELDVLGTGIAGLGGPTIYMGADFPFSGSVWINIDSVRKWREDVDNKAYWDAKFYETVLHEIGHVLGIGSLWDRFVKDWSLDTPGADTHFTGGRAVAAFNAAGGTHYTGKKVPVENDSSFGYGSQDAHWRESVFGNELMSTAPSTEPEVLSAITIQALADLGYKVDISKADPYRLP